MKRGIFITFEGPEGSGKSTHLQRLAGYLLKKGRPIVTTREPGGTPFARPLRRLLLQTSEDLSPLAELLLYEADRAQHVCEFLEPALARGRWVLCDRYTDSTLAYQGYGRGLAREAIATLNRIASRALVPDLTLLLDVPAARGLAQAHRKKSGHDRLEKAGLAFHERVRRGFLALARRDPARFRVIPQERDPAATQHRIRLAVDTFLKDRKMA